MIDIKTIELLVDSLTAKLPASFDSTKRDIEANFKAIIQQQFTKLDLVTREEFDVQTAVLARTRSKLEALHESLAQLEAKT
ncbi:MAG TPA: accessory factor UbiK family protein [Cycloclasticus sp.]|jgi:BMFP domain-containing protein YqiC|nr:accessory factor UbiK family protein [Cycloclasticus sp.]